eukprot:Clim_evm19s25 gene=Clim_evmTU19s25
MDIKTTTQNNKNNHQRQPVHLEWKDLVLEVDIKPKDGSKPYARKILQGLTGSVRPGDSLVVMGPTGGGKTTFLDTLADKMASGRQSGTITFNGQPRDKYFKRFAAYVMQFDSLKPELTVRETLEYAQNLTLDPDEFTDEEKETYLIKILRQLGLESAANERVGGGFFKGISAGQRKRLSIGVELMKMPSLVFLDEPTTGLDSATAYQVMKTIDGLAKSGLTVISTIHQPNPQMYDLFDKIMLLSQGRLAFLGPAKAAPGFFKRVGYPIPSFVNPADHYMDVVNVDYIGDFGQVDVQSIVDEFAATRSQYEFDSEATEARKRRWAPERNPTQPVTFQSTFAVPATKQFGTLLKRNIISAWRNPLVYWGRVVMYFMLAVVMGTLYFDIGDNFSNILNRISVIFFVVAFFTFMQVSAMPAMLEERDVFTRERGNGNYGVMTYSLANAVAAVPWVALTAVTSSVPVYFMIGLNDDNGRYLYFLLMFFLALYVAESVVVVTSAVVNIALVGIAAAAAFFGFSMLTCGFFLSPGNIPDYWIWAFYISFHKYAFNGLIYNDFSTITFEDGTITGTYVLDSRFEITKDERWLDVGVMILLIIFYRMLFAGLLWKYQTGRK